MSQPNIPYILSEKLGSGTYANVYKAFKKTGIREVVAIKCIKKSRLNKISTENLLQEIELLKTLRHDNIVGLVDFFWDAGMIYLVLEFCSGGDLFKFIRQRRRLSESVVRHFLRQLASALHYLRQHNVVHMDLKPQNLLLTSGESPLLKVADFGFAHHLELPSSGDEKPDEPGASSVDSVALDQIRGSLLYMAPEIVTRRQYGPKCDLWSTGVIMFECLFGKAPFASESIEELAEKIRSEDPVMVPQSSEITLDCHDLLCRLLQRDPGKRIDYPDFFGHTFVDLEHIPSSESLPRGNELVQEAVAADSGGRLRDAVRLYTEALRHLVPAIQYEKNESRKDALRSKVTGYMDRAELLRERLASGGGSRQQRSAAEEADCLSELARICQNDLALVKAVQDLRHYYGLVDARDYLEALKHFEIAAEKMLPLIRNDSDANRKKLFHEEVSRAMSSAEDLKTLLTSNKRPKSHQIILDEATTDALRKEKNCGVM